jgi:predicted TIM-barrel fold metal-dependent hydrolase
MTDAAAPREEILEPALPIVDPHHHLWDRRLNPAELPPPRHGFENVMRLAPRYLWDELYADMSRGHNVRATVFVQCGAMYRADGPVALRPIGETEFVNGVAAMSASGVYGDVRACAGIVGHVDLTLGEATVSEVLQAQILAGNGRFRGIRHGVTWDIGNAARFGRRQVPRHQVLDPAFQQGFARLEPMGLSFESWQFHPQLPDLVQLLNKFPRTTVILNHVGGLLGIPPHDYDREEVFNVWRSNIREVAQFPNVSVKLGGLGMLYCGWDFHLRDIAPGSEELAVAWKPYIEACIEAFGPTRCMMESNFPVDKQSCGYAVLWNAMKRITAGYSAREKAALYQDTAARVYRLEV